VVSANIPEALVDVCGSRVGSPEVLAGARVFLLAGVARPASFEQLVVRCGAKVVGRCFVRDHGRFRPAQLRRAARSGAEWILCTEKDLVRIEAEAVEAPIVALRCRTRVVAGEPSLARAMARLVSSGVG
jgi:tetraacyldisaccharide-1-P 4'-kinase